MHQRNCAQCSTPFSPSRIDQRFCARLCSKRFHRDSRVTLCSHSDCDRPVRAKGLCSMHYRATKPRPKDKMTDARRASLRSRTQQRRASQRDPDAESIDRNLIGARDRWRCGLCGRRVNNALTYPHPMSASLDHIEPLSLGGKHILSNVQIAHLTCNVAKGNRGGGEQLLLIG